MPSLTHVSRVCMVEYTQSGPRVPCVYTGMVEYAQSDPRVYGRIYSVWPTCPVCVYGDGRVCPV